MGARLDVVPTKHDERAVAGWVDWFVPPPLTRRRIVHVALALVNESGLRRLTFDRLAGHLSVTPEVLRHHIADRAELIDALVDHVHALVLDRDAPVGPAAGLDAARHLLARHREIWSAHRPLIAAHGRGVLPGPATDELVDRLTGALRAAGLDRHEARTTGPLLLQ